MLNRIRQLRPKQRRLENLPEAHYVANAIKGLRPKKPNIDFQFIEDLSCHFQLHGSFDKVCIFKLKVEVGFQHATTIVSLVEIWSYVLRYMWVTMLTH